MIINHAFVIKAAVKTRKDRVRRASEHTEDLGDGTLGEGMGAPGPSPRLAPCISFIRVISW